MYTGWLGCWLGFDGTFSTVSEAIYRAAVHVDSAWSKSVYMCCCCVAFVVCFVEHPHRVTVTVTELLQKEAWDWFHVEATKVYVWQYNGRSLTTEHFLYLLNDIGKVLALVLFHSCTTSRPTVFSG